MAGCAPKEIYYWGDYEDLIYKNYSKPIAPEMQIEKLEADIQKAKGRALPLPPGFHAQLGYLYFQTGNGVEARKHFEAEKTKFPESTVLMDRFLKKLKKSS